MSPSPSRSAATIESAPPPNGEKKISCGFHSGAEPRLFSYQTIVLAEPPRTSGSPSPSMSAATTDSGPSLNGDEKITCSAHAGKGAPLFSCQEMSSGDAPTTSRSPSPSTSTTKTERLPKKLEEITVGEANGTAVASASCAENTTMASVERLHRPIAFPLRVQVASCPV